MRQYKNFLTKIKSLNNPEQEKALALAIHLKFLPEKKQTLDDFLSQFVSHDNAPDYFETDKEEYLILTEEEAEKRYEDYLDNYIDEIIFPEISDAYQMYFDQNAWKKDARINGDRGNALATYDGKENEVEVNNTNYFIFRTC